MVKYWKKHEPRTKISPVGPNSGRVDAAARVQSKRKRHSPYVAIVFFSLGSIILRCKCLLTLPLFAWQNNERVKLDAKQVLHNLKHLNPQKGTYSKSLSIGRHH